MATLSPVASLVRQHDRDRYVTALFAPHDRREALMALYAFNYEIARTREIVTEPMLGRIRLQWWRENLDAAYGGGAIRQHEVAEALTRAIRAFGLSREHFERLIASRELDLAEGPPETLAALEAYCEETSGRLVLLALESLGVRDEAAREAGREIGIAYALIGLVRAIPFHARARRQYLPTELVRATGLDLRALFELKPAHGLAAAVERLAERAQTHLDASRRRAAAMPAAALPALLPARVASVYLGRLARARFDVLDARVAAPAATSSLRLAWAALRRRY